MNKIISGKVRDIYELSDDKLVIVTTDRISAFDVVLPRPVKDKGKALNSIALFWFEFTKDIIPNHVISAALSDMPTYFQKQEFEGRTMMVKRLKILPFEFIVRGYMFGNMWDAYSKNQEFCGQTIKGDYQLAEKLSTPILTPSTKAHIGHDQYIPFRDLADTIGLNSANKIESICLKLYNICYEHALKKGIIIADTKFEFGLDADGQVCLADEIFTPDSSRFWDLNTYKLGVSPDSYDKQFVRDWLTENRVNGQMQFDSVPDYILNKTADIYAECLRRLVYG